MDFTREPIVECVITPKEGCRLVVRSSKGIGQQEEFFVDALELVSFGKAQFYRSLERPKSFLVPASDYEVLEVRETRVVLKKASAEKGAIKIGGGKSKEDRKDSRRSKKDKKQDRPEKQTKSDKASDSDTDESQQSDGESDEPNTSEARPEKKRRSRRRRRRSGEESDSSQEAVEVPVPPPGVPSEDEPSLPAPTPGESAERGTVASPSLSKLLPPPNTLIRESISRYRDDESFKGAFFEEGPQGSETSSSPEQSPSVEPSSDTEASENAAPFGESGGGDESYSAPAETEIPKEVSNETST